MNDLTAEKWAELSQKLEKELAEAEAKANASTRTSGRLVLAAFFLFVLAAGLAIVFNREGYALLIAMPPTLLFLICVMYVLRHRKVAELAREDAERIRRDIRQWKKRRPAES